ncbi:MAG: uroporphyrinogen decarboxylase family protein [Desulfobacteraceae bacterium]|nr:uroporphyrinogen decarboxylase family protein [Desulfobacteraceae bacterium]
MNAMTELMLRFQKGRRSTFHLGPFLPIAAAGKKGLVFNDVFRDADTMTSAARLSFELGFESTVLPFDLNVEAEVLGAAVAYHEGFEGHPVYPTVARRPVQTADDILPPTDIGSSGRMPTVLRALETLKRERPPRGAVGVLLPGPFTLAGQVVEPERLFVMLLKEANAAKAILKRLTEFLQRLKALYVSAGADFFTVEEGGAASISPRLFQRRLLPLLQALFSQKPLPMVLSVTGGTDPIVPFMTDCGADGICIDRKCDLGSAREKIDADVPLFSRCGDHDMLALSDPESIAAEVRHCLDQGMTTVLPPADIYPPAREENITAFVRALREDPSSAGQ